MAKTTIILTVLILILLERGFYYAFLKPPPLPEIALDAWWGPETGKGVSKVIKPYLVSFGNESVSTLRDRLQKSTYFAPPLEGTAFNYGFNTNVLREFVHYWGKQYNFTERERFFNKYPQYTTNIQGLDMHFLRVTPPARPGVATVPLLLLHGWPGSHREFFEAIPHLTAASQRDFQLEVVVPSLPGFGFSSAAVRPGLGSNEMAVVLRNLMHRLGYQQFYVQGGDFGAAIASAMATLFPDEVLGFHTNLAVLLFSPRAKLWEVIGSLYPPLVVEPRLAERMYPLSKRFEFYIQEGGYFLMQATKPDTIGAALTDSPAGLLAYILEKFSMGSGDGYLDKEDGGLPAFPKDHLIDNVMVYWTSRCITTAMRLYAESCSKRSRSSRMEEIPTQVPTWVMQAKHEIFYQPPFILRLKYPNLVNVTVLDDGGHFLAMEQPQVFADDVLKAVDAFRSLKEKAEL